MTFQRNFLRLLRLLPHICWQLRLQLFCQPRDNVHVRIKCIQQLLRARVIINFLFIDQKTRVSLVYVWSIELSRPVGCPLLHQEVSPKPIYRQELVLIILKNIATITCASFAHKLVFLCAW